MKPKLRVIYELFMVVIYWGMSGLLVFSPLFEERIIPVIRNVMGIVFFLYGAFRIFRLWRGRHNEN